MVVYDISNRTTFENVKNWVDDLPNFTKSETVVTIVGNKKDLADSNQNSRAIKTAELATLAKEKNCLFKETSAYYSQQSIEETFVELIRGKAV